MAAGEGTRLRPLTERWAKPVLPIDGRPVLSMLLRELAAAGVERVWLVTGYLAEQVEALAGDGSRFGLRIESVRQPGVLGSADAVQRALAAGAVLPVIVTAADTLFGRGDIRRFVQAFAAASAAGAVAVRLDPPPGPGRGAVQSVDGRVTTMKDDDPENRWSAAPLWAVGTAIAERLCLDREPYELENAYRGALEAGKTILGITIGKTRDLTDPLDLVEENFPYLIGT